MIYYYGGIKLEQERRILYSRDMTRIGRIGGENYRKLIYERELKMLRLLKNLPVESYSGRSMRVGFAKASMKMGIKEETTKARGGWSKKL
jgi:hypothetical protein